VLSGAACGTFDALHATRGLQAIIHGFVPRRGGGFRLKLDLEESFRRLLSAFARDLATRGRNDPATVAAE
jgi:hypothetical protein